MTFKVLKNSRSKFSCNVPIEHCHNHAVNSALRWSLQKQKWWLMLFFFFFGCNAFTGLLWVYIQNFLQNSLEENLFNSAHPSRFLYPSYYNHYFKSTVPIISRAARTYVQKTSMCFSFIRNLVGKSYCIITWRSWIAGNHTTSEFF